MYHVRAQYRGSYATWRRSFPRCSRARGEHICARPADGTYIDAARSATRPTKSTRRLGPLGTELLVRRLQGSPRRTVDAHLARAKRITEAIWRRHRSVP